MTSIRNLLLDCRAALRRSDRSFESTPLADVLDDEIIRIGRESEPAPPSEEPVARPHALPIAYAWQAAARELRGTHPDVHELLSRRVHERLREKVLNHADDEIDALRTQLHQRQATCAKLEQELAAVRVELDIAHRSPAIAPAVASAGAPAPAQDPRIPGQEQLRAVANGTAVLSAEHRDWCLAEALVLTGFERTPVQLMEDGEAALAALILAGKPVPA
ncbi:MAG: hypothetical protein M3Y70_04725 [Pseudomonadota bacterium]|nr:hypothetical protein [Pseudomonadota bacterium]